MASPSNSFSNTPEDNFIFVGASKVQQPYTPISLLAKSNGNYVAYNNSSSSSSTPTLMCSNTIPLPNREFKLFHIRDSNYTMKTFMNTVWSANAKGYLLTIDGSKLDNSSSSNSSKDSSNKDSNSSKDHIIFTLNSLEYNSNNNKKHIYHTFQSQLNKRYVCAEQKKGTIVVDREVAKEWEYFQILIAANAQVALMLVSHNFYVSYKNFEINNNTTPSSPAASASPSVNSKVKQHHNVNNNATTAVDAADDEEETNTATSSEISVKPYEAVQALMATKLVVAKYETFKAEIHDGKNAFRAINHPYHGRPLYITALPNGCVTLQSPSSSSLSASSSSSFSVDTNMLFTMQIHAQNEITLQSSYGTYLSIEPDTCVLRARLSNPTRMAMFKIHDV